MEDNRETLETMAERKRQVPQLVKVLAILVYIGNAFWALVFLVIFFWFMSANQSFQETFGLMDIPIAGFALVLVLLLAMFTLCIAGAYSMAVNKRKAGLWLFIGGNAFWVILNLAAGQQENLVVAIISIGFIVAFATKFKELE